MKRILYLIPLVYLPSVMVFSQEPQDQDKLIFLEKKPGFYQDSIQTSIKEFENKEIEKKSQLYISVDFADRDFPTQPESYHRIWHNDPVSQGATGTCWCFAATSFMESEVYRITSKKVKLSEMYTVYWEYVARAKYFVENRGEMYFGQGSESNAVTRIMKEHGVMPLSAYSGMLRDQRFHDHNKMYDEIREYLAHVKKTNMWNESQVVSTVRSILDHYMTRPPESFEVNGKNFTPGQYMEYLQLIPDNYFCFMSTLSKPYNQKGELTEPDNWWHSDEYYNLGLEDFFSVITLSLDNGYTISICGDVSEPGYDRYTEVGIIPTFDIPREYINADAREYRVQNNVTTDDHCIHIVGYTKKDDGYWFLIKDSSSSAFDGPNKGYRFMREDYINLKILALMTHKYAAREVLDKVIK